MVLSVNTMQAVSEKTDVTYYYDQNPVFRAILGSGQRKVFRLLVILAFWYALLIGACWKDDALVLPHPQVGFCSDLYTHFEFGAVVVLVLLALELLKKLDRFLRVLPLLVFQAEHVDALERAEWIRSFVSLRNLSGRRWHAFLMVTMGCLVLVFAVLSLGWDIGRSWSLPKAFPLSYCIAVAWVCFAWIFVLGNIIWYVFSIAVCLFLTLRRYVKTEKLVLAMTSPDGKGGFASVGDLVSGITITFGGGIPFLILWTIVYGVDPNVIACGIVYLLCLTGVFLAPAMIIHSAMSHLKTKEITYLSSLFEAEYKKLPRVMDARRQENEFVTVETKEILRTLSNIDRLYSRAEALPEWPFNTKVLSQFLTMIIVPLIVFVIQYFTQNGLSQLFR